MIFLKKRPIFDTSLNLRRRIIKNLNFQFVNICCIKNCKFCNSMRISNKNYQLVVDNESSLMI